MYVGVKYIATVPDTTSDPVISREPGPKSINTGGENGAYHTLFCPPLPSALSDEYFRGYKCTPSKGTLDNIDRVLEYPTSVGFVQLDIFANEAIKRSEEFKKLIVIRRDIACEGLWMVTRSPRLANFGEIQARARRIPFILPPKSSGSAASFAFLQTIDPEHLGRVPVANVSNMEKDATEVLNELASRADGAVGFFVQFADPENANIKMIVENGLKVIPVVSGDVLRTKLNDQPVYQLQTFILRAGGLFVDAREETTACTPVAIITGAPEAFVGDDDKVANQKAMIQKISDVPPEKLLPQESGAAAVIKYAKKLSNQAVETLISLVENARQMIENNSP